MRLKPWLYRVASVSVALALSACTGSNVFSNSPENSGGYSHYKGHGKYAAPDNAASQDYFNNIPEGDNLWSSIRENFQIEHYADAPQVQAQLNWFMHNQGYLDRTARRAAPYMYYIYQQVKTRHLPSELVLLPIIESAYNPFVSSSAGAAGLWQLEPGTARTFGVHADFWYDGRRDINASTKAALDYFSYLQNLFGGNWLLAIAAYNTGEGNVEAAVRHNARLGLNTDFWSLPLAAETKSYVPRLLALAIIVSDPARYHIQLPPISNSPYLGEVDVSSQLNLQKAASLAGVSLDELKTLNPGYRRNTLDPNQPYKILLPLDRVNFFRENLLREASGGNGLWGRYTVQEGDTWDKISKQFNTPATLLQQINKMNTSAPTAGSILLIPENKQNESAIASATAAATANTQTPASPIAAPDLSDAADLDKSAMQHYEQQNQAPSKEGLRFVKVIHTVRRGETLERIAAKYKVTTEEIAHWNHISAHTPVRAGHRLTIIKREEIHSRHAINHGRHEVRHPTHHKSTHTTRHTKTHTTHKSERRHH